MFFPQPPPLDSAAFVPPKLQKTEPVSPGKLASFRFENMSKDDKCEYKLVPKLGQRRTLAKIIIPLSLSVVVRVRVRPAEYY